VRKPWVVRGRPLCAFLHLTAHKYDSFQRQTHPVHSWGRDSLSLVRRGSSAITIFAEAAINSVEIAIRLRFLSTIVGNRLRRRLLEA